jgi:hypothetical protein
MLIEAGMRRLVRPEVPHQVPTPFFSLPEGQAADGCREYDQSRMDRC